MPKASSHFWWLPTTLSIVLSTLGILALAKHAFVTWSLSAPLELVMAAYNATMQLLFGWAHPYLQAALTWLGSFIGWRPMLYPHWRDVFVVLGIFGAGYIRAGSREGLWNDRPFEGILLLAALTIVVVVAALAVGILPLQSPLTRMQLVIAVLPGGLLGLVVLAFTPDRHAPVYFMLTAILVSFFLCGIPALFALLLIAVFGTASGMGLLAVALALIVYAILLAATPDETTLNGPAGRNILGGFVGAAVVAAVDAGLKLLGA